MAEKKTDTETRKVKKKLWYEIKAPNLFNGVILGESFSYSVEDLLGRVLEISLGELSGDLKRQSVKVLFKVVSVEGARAVSEVIGYKLSISHLRKLVRAGTDKVEDSILLETKDNVKVRVKMLFLTRSLVQKGVLTSLRMQSRSVLSDEFKKYTFEEIIERAVEYKLQSEVKKVLKKIYPLASCEFKIIQRVITPKMESK